jgi:hypothetical protein
MRLYLSFFLSLAISSSVMADAVDINKPEILLKVSTEDSQKVILATVTAGGKPLANATINFYAKRTFGNLNIGHDVTLDDGTAAVHFPVDLPGGTAGRLEVIAIISNPPQYGSFHVETAFDGDGIVPVKTEIFPRALWAPQAPLVLILTIAVLLTVVWGTYVFVLTDIIKIRKEGIK